MINNINKNSYNVNSYIKPSLNNNDKIAQKQSTLKDIETKDFLLRIKEELKNVELIAIKIIKGEKLTPSEQRLINEKYTDIKKLAQQSKEEVKDLKEQMKNCKTDEERQKIISKAISNIKLMGKKGLLSQLEVRIKMSALEEVEKFSQKIIKENKKSELIAIKIVKGEKLTPSERIVIDSEYPEIKQLVEQSFKEGKELKEHIKNCKTYDEKQKLIFNAMRDLEDIAQKGILSPLQFKLKMLFIETIKKETERENNKLFSLNPYIYLTQEVMSKNLVQILITIVIIVMFLYIV
jgi:ethanolamine utilization cobalamin adenosyltransferase